MVDVTAVKSAIRRAHARAGAAAEAQRAAQTTAREADSLARQLQTITAASALLTQFAESRRASVSGVVSAAVTSALQQTLDPTFSATFGADGERATSVDITAGDFTGRVGDFGESTHNVVNFALEVEFFHLVRQRLPQVAPLLAFDEPFPGFEPWRFRQVQTILDACGDVFQVIVTTNHPGMLPSTAVVVDVGDATNADLDPAVAGDR